MPQIYHLPRTIKFRPWMPVWSYSDDFSEGDQYWTKVDGDDASFDGNNVTGGDSLIYPGTYFYVKDARSRNMIVAADLNPSDEGSDLFLGVLGRMNSNLHGYGALTVRRHEGDGGDTTWLIRDYNGRTQIGSSLSMTGGRLYLKIEGSQIWLRYEEAGTWQICVTDSTIAEGRKAGFTMQMDSGVYHVSLDNWSCSSVDGCPEQAALQPEDEMAVLWLPMAGDGTSRNPWRPMATKDVPYWYDDSIFAPGNQKHAAVRVYVRDAHKFKEAVPETTVDALTVACWKMVTRLRINAYLVPRGVHPSRVSPECHDRDHSWPSVLLPNEDRIFRRPDFFTSVTNKQVVSAGNAGTLATEICGGPDDKLEMVLEDQPARSLEDKQKLASMILLANRYHCSATRAMMVAQKRKVHDTVLFSGVTLADHLEDQVNAEN